MSEFFQSGPELGNQYEDDAVLKSYLRRKLPREALHAIVPELQALGEKAVTDIQRLGDQVEANPPKHIPFDPWGRRIDRIEVSPAWLRLEEISAREGLVAIAYEREHGESSRLIQFAKVHLFGPSSAIYTCPLAMTDGAARAIELYGSDELKSGALKRLTSRDPANFWTSGQWMTERTGGSDVSMTSTIARREGNGFRLYGTKWFTSATTSQMAMTLARIEGAPSGSRGLSLFYVQLRDENGALQGIRVHRLKDKLGTRALPTAELSLEGTPAILVGGEGEGVKKIASLFNITRVWNACSSVGYIRRGLALARAYATRRVAFGKPLIEQPLHQALLAELEVEYRASFHLAFHAVELLGKCETGTGGPAEAACLRMMTPLAKLFTAKQAIRVSSEVLEAFGGAGYVEDTGIPRLLRDSQVLAIWEGTTNVLSLDVLRAIERERALEPFLESIVARVSSSGNGKLADAKKAIQDELSKMNSYLAASAKASPERIQAGARNFAMTLARVAAGALLIETAEETQDVLDIETARRWCLGSGSVLSLATEDEMKLTRGLARGEAE